MRVVIASDSFGGTLSPVEAAHAMADGWLHARPDDDVVMCPMSDGGEGLLEAVEVAMATAGRTVERHEVEVVDPRGLAVMASWLSIDDGQTAVIESAQACGLALVAPERRNPRLTTTWGVGQLIEAVARSGASRVLVGLGGSATVDGGAGALSGLGWRVQVEDGSGLKIGGDDLPRVAAIRPGWVHPSVAAVSIDLLTDVRTTLPDAPRVFGPQKGADKATIAHLEAGLGAWATVVEETFEVAGLRDRHGTGAAGGLGFALIGAHGAVSHPGAQAVARLVGLDRLLADADLVLTGEGRFDATSLDGKVVGHVIDRARAASCDVLVLAGQIRDVPTSDGLSGVRMLAASPDGLPLDAVAALRSAATTAAERENR